MPIARIATGLVLAAAVLAGIYGLAPNIVTFAFIGVVFVAAVEWAALTGIRAMPGRLIYAGIIVVIVLGTWLLAQDQAWQLAILRIGCLWWGLAAVWVLTYQLHEKPKFTGAALFAVAGAFVFAPALVALADLLARGPETVVTLFAVVWAADILAYAGGRTWGRRKLAARVSPGKTWEGLASGAVGTLIVACGLYAWSPVVSLRPFLMVVAFTFLAAVVGDLLESLVKRQRGVKDSGSLLPGHGGVLDRIDSLLAAAPVFALALIATDQI